MDLRGPLMYKFIEKHCPNCDMPSVADIRLYPTGSGGPGTRINVCVHACGFVERKPVHPGLFCVTPTTPSADVGLTGPSAQTGLETGHKASYLPGPCPNCCSEYLYGRWAPIQDSWGGALGKLTVTCPNTECDARIVYTQYIHEPEAAWMLSGNSVLSF